MEKDLNNKEFYNDMLKEMVKIITVSKTEMSVMQTAEAILHEYIKRTEHHIWLVNQCAGILKDVLVENGQDVSEFMARVEYHDYDKLHNPKIIPVYAVACDYYYGEGKKNYEVYEEGLYNEFELIAWPEHHRANVHHVAEHYGKSQGKDKPFIVPPTQDYLAIGEMIADWMAMSITHGDSAREWYKKTKGVKWVFEPIDEKIIEKFLKAEDEAHNQLAYLRQFKTWEVSTVAMQQTPTISEEDPQENNGVNEGIENFYREMEKSEDVDTKDTLYIEPIEQENLVDDESSELDTYIEQISKLVKEMEPMTLKHKLGKYDDDELAIGKISDKNINMDIVNELMKYPRYLEVLKHWITVPDYTLLPDLARFGAIIDNIYKFNKPIVAYRGMRVGLVKAYKAQHEMGLVVTEDGGMNDDGIEMVLKVPKPGVNEGYSFDYTIDGPLSVSRSIWITKIYGNLIVKTVIPPTAKKLVITNELAYVLQKLEARYFNYRPMNLSSRTEIILFPNQTFKFEVVTTHGDISEELSEFNEMFYNLQEDTDEVIAGSENSIGHEAFCDQLLDTSSNENIFTDIFTSLSGWFIESSLGKAIYAMACSGEDDPLALSDRIDKSKLNKSKIDFFFKHEKECHTLLKWLTAPDYTLQDDLQKFGIMIDNLYNFKLPFWVFRSIRSGFSLKHPQQHMGLLDEESGFFNKLKPYVRRGYKFNYTPVGPMSVSRCAYVSKIYGNVITRCKIPVGMNKLVITGELAYVLDKLQRTKYPMCRKINLSCITEIIVFANNQPTEWEVISTTGDIQESVILNISNEGFFDAVSEKDTMHYTIRNFPAAAFLAKMKREYKTTKLEHLFSSIGIKWFSHRSVSIHKFFVPELLYLLQKFNFPKSLISSIEQNTWVSKPTEVTVAQNIGLIDKNMKCELFKHQQEFINSYSANKHENHLRGYLLSFDQGLGKTITALALMESLGKERVIIICPKNTMVETWGYHIETFYKNKQTIWYSGGKEKLTNQRFLIVNYDRISEIEAVAMSSKNLGIIVDESHNFLRTASQRTKILMEIASSTNDADILLQSGTPIKCTGVEMIPMMSVLDPYFDQEAVNTFKQTFGFNTSIANDVLHARLNRMMTRVTKSILDLPKKEESIIKVKMTTGKKYTLGVVKEGVRKFIAERRAYYHSKAKEYNDAFDAVLEWLDMSPMFKKDFDYMKWRGIIDWLRSEDISDVRGNTEIVWANKYEIEVIEPALPPELCKQFRWCKTAVKYVNLKIKGEVIGTYLMRLRMDMTSEMLEAADIKQYVDNAVKKTIIFTSYVDTIESAEKYFKNNGYNPLVVYGKTSSELTETVRRFQSDPGTNPLIASLKMLSTGATLTAANTVIFLNKPWRSIEYQQASDRVHRIGQDTDCVIYSLVLDTGAEDNLSTRMEDVMNWSDDQFSQIVDSKERSFLERVFGPMPIINWVRSFFSNEEYTNEDAVRIDSSSNESMVLLQSNPQERELTRLAKQLYNPTGANSWEHIQQVVGQASLMVNGVYKRTLNLKEYAACLFHDCSVKSRPDKVKHSLYSAEIAKPILTKTGYFTPEEVEEVYQAIVEHDGETNPNFVHSTLTSDVLSSADTNPPNVAWILNKMYVYRLRHNRPAELIFKDIAEYSKEAYGLKSKRRYPTLYANFYGKEIVTMGKTIDSLTPEDCERIIMDYRARHNLGPNDLTFPDPSLESIAVEALSTKEYTEADINSVEDLKEFYKHCSYGLIDFKANKPWKETHKNTTFEDWEEHWRLLSVEQLLKFKCGVCYDTAKANDYFLTKLKVDHVNLFAMTKRDVESADYNDDPTHTFTVYKDSDNKWKWLEGSWGLHKNNTLSASSADGIIKQVAQILANACGRTNYIGVVTKFPADGVNMATFYNVLKKFVINPKMIAEPDKSYSKESITPQVEQNIVDGKVYHASPFKLDKLSGNATKKWSGETGSVFVSPCKGLMPCFCINKDDVLKVAQEQLGGRLVGLNFGYDVWNWSVDKLRTLPSKVTILLNVRGLKPFTGESTGYLYTIDYEKYKDKTHMFNKNMDSNVEFLIEGDVDYIKCEKITVKWECKSSEEEIKRKGEAKLISNEALSPDVKKKKQLIIDYICSICDIIDPSKLNSKRYHRLLDNMNDKEFDQWMQYVKEGKWRLHIVAPNLIINLKNENLLKAADKAKCKLFHRIWMTDHATGRQYLTDNEYLVLTLPVRRQQQFLDEKMSVPDNDRQIDGMTGQVTGDSRSSSITNPEIQILASRKLDATLEELVNVRGGNMLAYGEFKRQAEETGEINMSMFDPNTRSRVAVVGQVLLNSMHIDTNIIE